MKPTLDLTACQVLAQWVVSIDRTTLPEDILSDIKLHFIDTLGALLIGMHGEETPTLLDAIVHLEGRGERRVLPSNSTTTLLGAVAGQVALAGLAEIDGVHAYAMVRAGAMVVPTLLALAQERTISGEALLLGTVVGCEVGFRIGMATDGQRLLAQGIWPTSIIGPMCSAAAAAKALGLSAKQATHALAIAGLLSGGLGTGISEAPTGRHLVFGYAARSGAAAALAAEGGLTGPTRLFEDRRGFFSAFGDLETISSRATAIVEGLGKRFEIKQAGFKLYPCARQTHAALDALGNIMAENHLNPNDLENIEVSLPPASVLIVDKPKAPESRMAALSSIQFVLAALAVRGQVGLDELAAEARADRRILDLQQRVHVHPDEELKKLARVSARVRVLSRKGENWEATVLLPRGDANNPVTPEMVRQKFLQQAEPVLGQARAQEVLGLANELESLTDAHPLLAALTI